MGAQLDPGACGQCLVSRWQPWPASVGPWAWLWVAALPSWLHVLDERGARLQLCLQQQWRRRHMPPSPLNTGCCRPMRLGPSQKTQANPLKEDRVLGLG